MLTPFTGRYHPSMPQSQPNISSSNTVEARSHRKTVKTAALVRRIHGSTRTAIGTGRASSTRDKVAGRHYRAILATLPTFVAARLNVSLASLARLATIVLASSMGDGFGLIIDRKNMATPVASPIETPIKRPFQNVFLVTAIPPPRQTWNYDFVPPTLRVRCLSSRMDLTVRSRGSTSTPPS